MQIMIADKMREITKIKPHQVEELLKDGLPILIYGRSGRGKSAIVRQYAKKAGKKLKIINLAMEMPEAMGGIPYVDLSDDGKTKVKEYFVKLMNRELKEIFDCHGKDWILFFDEVNQGTAEVFNTMYSIWHENPEERSWAGHPLEYIQVVAAGNLDDGTDGTVYLNQLPTPLHNRVDIFELVDCKEDTRKHLAEVWENLPCARLYIDAMLDENIPPRDIEHCLRIISCNYSKLRLEAKLGEALARKICEIQKDAEHFNPAEALKICREQYAKFKEIGCIRINEQTLETEADVIKAFRAILSEEEIQSIVKGEE